MRQISSSFIVYPYPFFLYEIGAVFAASENITDDIDLVIHFEYKRVQKLHNAYNFAMSWTHNDNR